MSFLDAVDYETTVKNAISLGDDADTKACIAGGIAQAFYKKITADIVLEAREKLTKDLLVVVDQFNQKFKRRYWTVRHRILKISLLSKFTDKHSHPM